MDDKNLAPGLTEYSALSMVDFFVLPHWKEFPFEESSQQTAAAYDGQLKLLKLTNQQAVLVTGHTNVIENAQ